MQKKFFGLAVLLLVSAVLITGCGKKDNNQPASDKQNQEQANNQADDTLNPSGEYTINELLTMNKPLKCSWKESATGDGDVTNIMYLNGKKFYQDVTMGDIGHAYTISDGEYLYIWNDFTNVASKMKITDTKTNSEQAKTQGSAGLEQKRDFVCEKWSADNSIFTPPQGKDFKDVTDEMNQVVNELQQNSGKANQQMCDLCQSAPTPEVKEQCLTNAKCNE